MTTGAGGYITPKLPNRIITITRNADRVITIRRRDPVTAAAVNWDAQLHMKIDVDPATVADIPATVEGSLATVRMESDLLDTLRKGTTWRLIMSQGSNPSLETPVMVGIFERNDGK